MTSHYSDLGGSIIIPEIGIMCLSRLLLLAHGRKRLKPLSHGPTRQRINEEDKKIREEFLNFPYLHIMQREQNRWKFHEVFQGIYLQDVWVSRFVCQFKYSKNQHKRTRVFGLQADFVLIYRVFSAKTV